jgi:hypothetical protein
MSESGALGALLTCCHGFTVAARGNRVGAVETPVFSGSSLEPVSLIVRTADSIPGTFRVVPLALVADVDSTTRRIALSIGPNEIARLDELVPTRQPSPAVRALHAQPDSIFAARRS